MQKIMIKLAIKFSKENMIQKYVKVKGQDWKHVHNGFTYRFRENLEYLIASAWDSANFYFFGKKIAKCSD